MDASNAKRPYVLPEDEVESLWFLGNLGHAAGVHAIELLGPPPTRGGVSIG